MSWRDWIDIASAAIGVVGLAFAFWQWHGAKAQGSALTAFLHGLKGAELPPNTVLQINDMLARLDPPRKQRPPAGH